MSLEEIREQNKQRVVQAALDVFVCQGIAGTTVADIARAAGVTERSVYRYYKTKLDLVQAAAYLYYDRMTQEANLRAQKVCASGVPGIEQVRQILMFRVSRANSFLRGCRDGAQLCRPGERGCELAAGAV